jgi:nicotinamidase-related amidase
MRSLDMDTRNTLRQPPPVLVCVDVQQEYLSPGRRHAMAGTAEVLDTCTTLLDHWRSRLWPVLHLKRVAHSAWFNPASNLTDWVPAFRPRPGEMAFEHPLPSAYSSARFDEYISHVGVTTCVLAGFSLEETVLATVIEGYHRGHDLHVIEKAVACGGFEGCELGVYRRILLQLIENYAGVQTLEDVNRRFVELTR